MTLIQPCAERAAPRRAATRRLRIPDNCEGAGLCSLAVPFRTRLHEVVLRCRFEGGWGFEGQPRLADYPTFKTTAKS